MVYLIVPVLLVAVLLVFYTMGLFNSLLGISPMDYIRLPYRTRAYLLTKAECSFYEVLLLTATKFNFRVFAKVRVADVLYVPKGVTNRVKYWDQIQSKHIDFILCDAVNLKPLIAIELKNPGLIVAEKSGKDIFVRKAFKDAGLPIINFPAKMAYNEAELSAKLQALLVPVAQVLVRREERRLNM